MKIPTNTIFWASPPLGEVVKTKTQPTTQFNWSLRLDYILTPLSTHPPHKLSVVVVNCPASRQGQLYNCTVTDQSAVQRHAYTEVDGDKNFDYNFFYSAFMI
jgi:hypothetical protein